MGLHGDDTPVPVLAPGAGKTNTGRLWVYLHDERPFGGEGPPAALFFYPPDRKGEHPRVHLKDFRGVIHADGYAGFNELFAGNRIAEAACWVHVRRKFFDVHAATSSPIAKEALDPIGQLCYESLREGVLWRRLSLSGWTWRRAPRSRPPAWCSKLGTC
jgi:transposase